MGWSLGWDSKWNRDIGYGVPAWCDHPKCKKEVDRGLSYVCGGQPYGGDHGCGLYFCEKHLSFFTGCYQKCARCQKGMKPFEPKPDHHDWIKHKMTDESWSKWREDQKKGAPHAP